MVTTRSWHSRITPAPKQQTLGRQRKTVRRRDSSSKLERGQSALRSQIDFIRTPASSRREVATTSSDHEDYEEPRPKKKQKRNGTKAKGRHPNQSSLTQKWGQPTIPKRTPLEIKDSEDEGEDELDMMHERSDAFDRTSTFGPLRCGPELGDVDLEAGAKPFKYVRLGSSPDVEEESTRPSTANSNVNVSQATPSKPRRTEIPSSVTPQSVHSSGQLDFSRDDVFRWPMKERSVNVACPSRPSPLKAGGLHDLEFGPDDVLPEELKGNAEPSRAWSATLAITPKKDRRTRRKFERTTTIQDSEDEDMELDATPVPFELTVFQDVKQCGQINAPLFAALEAFQEGVCPESRTLPQVLVGADSLQEHGEESDCATRKRSGVVPDSEESTGCKDDNDICVAKSQIPKQSPSTFQTEQTELIFRQDQLETAEKSDTHGAKAPACTPPLSASTVRDTKSIIVNEGRRNLVEPRSRENFTSSSKTGLAALSHPSTQMVVKNDHKTPFALPNNKDLDKTPTHMVYMDTPPKTSQLEARLNTYEPDVPENTINKHHDDDDDFDQDVEYTNTLFPQTYDPAAAALARDAARFGKTETQLEQEEVFPDQEEETSGPDQPQDVSNQETERVPSSQPIEGLVPSSLQRVGNQVARDQIAHQDLSNTGYVDNSGSCPHASKKAVERIPSSQPLEGQAEAIRDYAGPAGTRSHSDNLQDDAEESSGAHFLKPSLHRDRTQQETDKQRSQPPALRPSQTSTVCDTQSQTSRPNSSHGPPDLGPRTPRKHAVSWQGTLTSSPVPLPPGLGSQIRYAIETQGGSLADFSLPPPPTRYSIDSEL